MNTIPSRYDSQCCGAVGSSPSHRPGCKFEIAAAIANAPLVQRARIVAAELAQDWEHTSEGEAALVQVMEIIDEAAIGIAP